jgi:hypothetical protein
MKLDKEELEELTRLHGTLQKSKMAIGDLELQKATLIDSVRQLKKEFTAAEDRLIEKYGKDSIINMQTGEVKQKDNG